MNNASHVASKQKAFDLLTELARFASDQRVSLNDPTVIEQFFAHSEPRLREALADKILMHGARTERLFEAMVRSLGQCRLLKREDVGQVYGAENMRAPDFRVVLTDGTQWLIEVKNSRSEEPFKQQLRLSAEYMASINAYAIAVGAPVKLAVYWSLWKIWTLVSPERFQLPDGSLQLSMQEATIANELGSLGDVIIMTKPPLRLFFEASRELPRTIDKDGMVKLVIGASRVFIGGVELTQSDDRRLAELFLSFGEWVMEGPFAVGQGDELDGVEFVLSPEEPSNQGWEGIGTASRMFSRYYAAQTVDGDNQIVQLNGKPVPEWFAPLAEWDFKASDLPLLLLRQSRPDAADATREEGHGT